jgi:uncharacterized membrane protein
MSNPLLSEQLTTALVAALGLPSVNFVDAHAEPMKAADMGRKRDAEHDAAGMAERGYGLVLERRKDFVAGTGITGAATGRIDPFGDTLTLEPKGTCLTIGPLKSPGA